MSRMPPHRQPLLAAQCRLDSPLGPMTAAASGLGLVGLWFDDQAHHPGPLAAPDDPAHPVLQATARALALYWSGQADRINLQAAGQGAHAPPPKARQTTPRHLPVNLPVNLPVDLVLDLHGSPFQRAVWLALLTIPSGQTRRYSDIAQAAGRPAAVRAAGAAIGRNPVSVLVPCHRVLGAQRQLTGYAGGLARKQALLAHEQAAAGDPPLARRPARPATPAAALQTPATTRLPA